MDKIERLASEVVRTGREFGELWLNSGVHTSSTLRGLWPATISRLQKRLPFAPEDADVIMLMGEDISRQLRSSRVTFDDPDCDDPRAMAEQISVFARLSRLAISLAQFWEAQNALQDHIAA